MPSFDPVVKPEREASSDTVTVVENSVVGVPSRFTLPTVVTRPPMDDRSPSSWDGLDSTARVDESALADDVPVGRDTLSQVFPPVIEDSAGERRYSVGPSATTLTVSLPLPTRPDSAGTVAVSLPASVVRSTAPEASTRSVVPDEVVRVAETVKATEVADVDAAAAAPRAPPEPGVGELPPPRSPPKAAAPNATAAMSEATTVATAIRRAPPAAAAGVGTGPAGPAGGSAALTRCPGASSGVR